MKISEAMEKYATDLAARIWPPPAAAEPPPSPTVNETDLAWYIGYTHSRAELNTAERLTEAGFAAYVPMAKRRKFIRHRRCTTGRWTNVEMPLFGNYIFVGMRPGDMRWEITKDSDGTTPMGILTNHGAPVRVPWATIEGLHVAEDMGLFDDTGLSAPPFKAGDAVHIEEGLLGGFDAKVLCMNHRRRARLEIDGMSRPVEVPIDILRMLGSGL